MNPAAEDAPLIDELDELMLELSEDPETREAMEDAAELFRVLDALRTIRKQRGLKQRDVAARMGTTQSAVSKIEGGANDPQITTLMRYARALDARVNLRACIDAPRQNPDAQLWVAASSARPSHRPGVRPARVASVSYLPQKAA